MAKGRYDPARLYYQPDDADEIAPSSTVTHPRAEVERRQRDSRRYGEAVVRVDLHQTPNWPLLFLAEQARDGYACAMSLP